MRKGLSYQRLREISRTYNPTGIAYSLTITLLATTATTIAFNQPSYGESTTFFCAVSKKIPVTFARTVDGKKIPMIRWVSKNSSLTPMQRCIEVSRKFQKSYDNGSLANIKTGTIRREKVICAPIRVNEACTNSNLLFTLKPGSGPSLTLQRLLNTRASASNGLEESGGNSSETSINIDTFLGSATESENE
jgi:hypothetical protein